MEKFYEYYETASSEDYDRIQLTIILQSVTK